MLRIRNRKRTPPLPPLNVFVLTQCTMGNNKARGSFEFAIFMFVVDVCLTISTIPSAAGNIWGPVPGVKLNVKVEATFYEMVGGLD